MGEVNLHDTTDAAVWAEEFCKRYPSALCQIKGKEGVSDGDDFKDTMIGWFANAIMAGVDSEARKREQPRSLSTSSTIAADAHYDRPEVGTEEGETCNRWSEADEDAPTAWQCKGVMIKDECGCCVWCDTCGAVA